MTNYINLKLDEYGLNDKSYRLDQIDFCSQEYWEKINHILTNTIKNFFLEKGKITCDKTELLQVLSVFIFQERLKSIDTITFTVSNPLMFLKKITPEPNIFDPIIISSCTINSFIDNPLPWWLKSDKELSNYSNKKSLWNKIKTLFKL